MDNFKFIQSLIAKCELDAERVNEAIYAFVEGNTDQYLSVMSYLTGVANHPEVPSLVEVDGDERILLDVNYFTGKVNYKEVNVCTFKVSPEEAALLENKVYDNYYSIPKEVRNGNGNDVVKVRHWTNDRTSLECWLEWAK